MDKVQTKSFAAQFLNELDAQVNEFLETLDPSNIRDIKTTSISVCNKDGYIEHFNTATVVYVTSK